MDAKQLRSLQPELAQWLEPFRVCFMRAVTFEQGTEAVSTPAAEMLQREWWRWPNLPQRIACYQRCRAASCESRRRQACLGNAT